MRRSDKEVTDFNEKLEILDKCDILHIGMVDNAKPYVVPVNFGYSVNDGHVDLYFHCATEGRKVDILAENPDVFFEAECCAEVVRGDSACKWTEKYASVMGSAKAEPVSTEDEKIKAFTIIMKKYGYEGMPHFDGNALARTRIYKLAVNEITAKKSRM